MNPFSILRHKKPIDVFSRSKKIIGLLIASVASIGMLSSCSDDLDIRHGIEEKEDGNLYISFVLPEAEHIITRAGEEDKEKTVNNLSVLVFDKSEILLRRFDVVTVLPSVQEALYASREYVYQLAVPVDLKSQKGDVYAVANTIVKTETGQKDLIEDFVVVDENNRDNSLNITKLQSLISNENVDAQGSFLMSGKLNDSTKELALVRTAAKLTLTEEEDLPDFSINGFSVYYVADNCFLNASSLPDPFCNSIDSETQKIIGADKKVPAEWDDMNDRFEAFVNPTKTHEDLKVYTYVIIDAQYKGKKTYYAVPLSKKDKEEEDTEYYYDILPNHWYDMRVIRVEKEGYDNPETAIEYHNDNQIWVVIHDHAARVFSMVTDGIHELGVQRSVNIEKTEGQEGEVSSTFYVKCYAADTDLFDAGREITITVTQGEDWIEVDTAPLNVNNVSDMAESQNDNYGHQLEYTVRIKNAETIYTEQTGTILVEWKGLKREVTINFNPNYDISKVSKVKLTISDKDANHTYEISDYWTFVKGDGTINTRDGNAPRLFGIKPADLTGNKKRINGFHFPMPYGKSEMWEYSYHVNFADADEFSGRTINSISYKVEGDEFIKKYVTVSLNETAKTAALSLNPSAKKLYTYAGGTVTFTVKYSEGSQEKSSDIKFSLYHTGFFHYEGDPINGKVYCSEIDKGYYYYEVVEMANNHWLDRNLGAKSNKMFIDDGTTEGLGYSASRGRYYNIASYQAFSDPEIILDMCPPGYHIPATAEWNVLRLASEFTTAEELFVDSSGSSISMTTTFYNSENGKIYFPRAKYYNDTQDSGTYQDGSNNGDSSVGYYWTVTPAPGMEKYEMGKWLRALYINGASSTYLNMQVLESKLNVRCVAGNSAPPQDNNYVSFNVHNVTHVYIFDKLTKSALTTFPGEPLGSADSSKKWQYFNITTSYSLDNLLVLFIKINDKGKLTLFTKDGDKFKDNLTFSENLLNEKYAWEVKRGYYYDFCETALDRADPIVTEEQPDECDYVDTEYGGGSGDGGGGGSSSGGGNEVGKGEWSQDIDPEGKIIWQGRQTVNWDKNEINFDKWINVPENSRIRIYGFPTDPTKSSWQVSFRPKEWGAYDGKDDIYYTYYNVNGYVEIILTKDFLTNIINKGIMFTGIDFTVYYVTLILEGGEYVKPEPIKGDYDWGGWYQDQGGYWTVLGDGLYDWSSVTPGSTLTFYNLQIWYAPEAWVKLYTTDNQTKVLGQYWANETNKNIVITLTKEIIDELAAGNGLYVKTNQFGMSNAALRIN